jgi:hypothetical protein
MILPPPTNPGLVIDTASIELALPILTDHRLIAVNEPDNPDPLPKYIEHAPAETKRQVIRELSANRTEYRIHEDTGLFEHPDTGLSTRQVRDETWSISPDDPLSMTGQSTWTCDMQRPGWSVTTVATASIGCTATHWIIAATVIAHEGGIKIFEKDFGETAIARDLM